MINKRDLRIVFMGTPDFAVGVLRSLVENGYPIVGVITAPDKPAGRGRKLRASAVKTYALSQDLPVLQPTKLKSEDFLAQLKALEANLQIVVAFRMLPKVVWQLPAYGTFNLHASLLPQYRGAAPINWAIINREKKTGVTTFFIDEKIDTGAIIASEEVDILENETVGSLHVTLMEVGSKLVLKTVDLIEEDKVTPINQPKTEVFKEAPKLNFENTRIDWTHSMESIDALVRGLNPYPVAWTTLFEQDTEQKVKIHQVSAIEESHDYPIGSIISSKKELKVAVEKGYLYIKELQLPGKRKMKIADLLNGYSFEKGARFV